MKEASKNTEENKNQSQELYSKYREDLLKRQLSNNENYDRAILTLSTAALGMTVTFIRDLKQPDWIAALMIAWICMVIAIIAIVASYQLSQRAIKDHLEFAFDYYKRDDVSAADKVSPFSVWHERMVACAGVAFILGIISILFFFGLNLI